MNTSIIHRNFAAQIRITALRMVHRAKASHIGGALSMADILAILYAPGGRLNIDPTNPQLATRDRFILSKGHACVSLYAALALRGFIHESELINYAQDGSRLMSHASHKIPGIELSTGSLGHGLPVGCGFAYGAKLQQHNWRSIALLSDGELDEGSNWEAFLFAAHHKLDNLWAIIDANQIQSLGRIEDVIGLEPLREKLSSFGWSVIECNGHNHEELWASLDLNKPPCPGRPTVLIARTVKGKGVSFMENQLQWHYKSPNDEQLATAIVEIEQNA